MHNYIKALEQTEIRYNNVTTNEYGNITSVL